MAYAKSYPESNSYLISITWSLEADSSQDQTKLQKSLHEHSYLQNFIVANNENIHKIYVREENGTKSNKFETLFKMHASI